jgi:hypothetical protein
MLVPHLASAKSSPASQRLAAAMCSLMPADAVVMIFF